MSYYQAILGFIKVQLGFRPLRLEAASPENAALVFCIASMASVATVSPGDLWLWSWPETDIGTYWDQALPGFSGFRQSLEDLLTQPFGRTAPHSSSEAMRELDVSDVERRLKAAGWAVSAEASEGQMDSSFGVWR